MFVVFEKGRNGDPMTFIDGLPAFPPRGSINLGDAFSQAWEVEIEGKNPKGTCYFLKLLRQFGVDITEITGKVATSSTQSWVEVVPSDESPYSRNAIHPMQYEIDRQNMPGDIRKVFSVRQVWRFEVKNNEWGGGKLIPVELIDKCESSGLD